MACDYLAIRRDNKLRYGTDIGRIGPMLLADRYDDRTHFIFELLQNAEDALARRNGWQDSRAVSFHLTEEALRVSHFGLPFDELDVRGICGIAESTKDLTAIGRFGIGFKSVYALTDRPEVRSGSEAFAIESFVWPVAASEIVRDPDETIIAIPLRATDEFGHAEIADGLGGLGATALLFLRQIEEIRWSVEGGPSGLYLRESKQIESEIRRVSVIGQEHGQAEEEEEWLVFSRTVATNDGQHAGNVELAFSLSTDEESQRERIERLERSPLVVFFPTVVETHLGFLVQGPYRTTPSRDNVPRGDAWNQHLVTETASLLREALVWLRDNDLLDTAGLQCMPLDSTKFGEASMFAPLYEATKASLLSESLLRRFDAGHVSAGRARLGRTQELRELFTSTQLATIFEHESELEWLSGHITQDRTPALRRYLMQELGVPELTPETVIPHLDQGFLEAQADDWIVRLYEFLNGQPGLRRRFEDLPLARLEDGAHVQPNLDGQPQAFLPGPIASGFPVVRAAVCASEASLEFLRSLGLTQPDPVDDVVRNVLPKYREDTVDLSDADYEADIRRILNAFGTDSKGQREKLLTALSDTAFVRAVDAGDGSKCVSTPGDVYLATERLKDLFAGVDDIILVDDQQACLRGEGIRELLEACGALRYLRPIEDSSLSWQERSELRVQAGHPETSGQKDRVKDWTLLGLDGLLEALPRLDSEDRRTKARLIWEELASLEERRGKGVFTGEYTWTHYGRYSTPVDAAFVRALNSAAWIPEANGYVQLPGLVLFETLGWRDNPFLQSKIRFKPPILDQLAKEAGIEPGVLDLLKKLGVTSEAELRKRLGVEDGTAPGGSETNGSVEDDNEKPPGDAHAPPRRDGKRTPGRAGARPFISYVAAHPDDEEPDPDGLDQAARMELEEKAIRVILSREPGWQRTPTHNPGFDLVEAGPDGQPVRWCEVKAMTGSLMDHPVGLSRKQFDCARDHGAAYWLYVVEQAGTDNARLVRIQDPAGKARTFTFDHGWLGIAEVDSEEEPKGTDEHGED